MNNRLLLTSLTVLLVVFLAAGCATSTPTAPAQRPTEEATEEPTVEDVTDASTDEPTDEAMTAEAAEMMDEAPAEVLFIDGMIPHHQQAVDMAEQALAGAEHEELRTMAQQIIDAQQKEIDQLEEWRGDWFKDVEPSMGMMLENLPSMDEMMLSMDESIPFDLRFIDAMIVHHEGAIIMAQGLLKAAVEHEELRALAQNIIDSQQEEIDQLKQWREEWFPEA